MKRSQLLGYLLTIIGASIAASVGMGCRSLPKEPEDSSFIQEKRSLPGTCKRNQRVSFVPQKAGGAALALLETEQASGYADDSDFSLHLMPSDFDHARSFACDGSICEVSVTKPMTLTRESRVDLTANLYLKYQTTQDDNGALLSRQVSVGNKTAHISIGKILDVDVEVGAFLKQDLQKKGLKALSSGTFVEANSKAQLPLLDLRGNIVAEGLNLQDLHVKGGSVSLIGKDKAAASPSSNAIANDGANLRGEMLPAAGKIRNDKPDVTWGALAGQCPEAFYP